MHDSPRKDAAARALSAGALCALLATSSQAQFQSDPLQPGLRWGDFATPGSPWIPMDVALAARGELLLAAPAVGQEALHLYSSAEQGISTPSATWSGVAGALGAVQVEAGDDAHELYSLVQMPEPDSLSRRTLVRGHGPTDLAPAWTHDLGFLTAGTARLVASPDGDRVLAALHDKDQQRVQLDWLDGQSGALLARRHVAGLGLYGLELSSDGQRAAVLAGLDLWVVDQDGSVELHESLSAVTEALALSGDGSSVAWGADDALQLARWDGTKFAVVASLGADPGEIVARADLSADGDTLAIAYWSTLAGSLVRVLCTDGHGNPTSLWVQPPTSGGLQNLPAVLEVAPNGERVMIGLWGSGGGEPELVLLSSTSGIPLAVADLPGSVHAMDFSEDGTRVALGIKQVHANQYGTTGAVLLFDTGERDLQQLSAAYLGGELRILSVGASSSTELYFFGTSSESALVIPGLSGSLRLRVDLPVAMFSALADPLGRAELALPVPNQASLAGLAITVQSLTLGGSAPGFSETRFAPILL